jgi:orotate phosphoribosyltransferase
MEGIEKLVERALEMRKQGLTEHEIEEELHLSQDTVQWLLSGQVQSQKPPSDVYVGWRTIGSRSTRIDMLCELFADVIVEEMEKTDTDFDACMGLAMTGVPLAQATAAIMDKDFIIYTVSDDYSHGKLSSNFAGMENKKVIIIDDVISSGKTMKLAIAKLKEMGSEPVLGLVLVNKTKQDDIDGMPIRALIRTIVV